MITWPSLIHTVDLLQTHGLCQDAAWVEAVRRLGEEAGRRQRTDYKQSGGGTEETTGKH